MTVVENMRARGIIPKAVLYARFSSDNQREESIDAQLRAMHEYCKRNKIIVVGEYCDLAKSATTDDRPQFLNMVTDSKNKGFDLAIVHKLDRFSRNRYDSAYYKRELKRNGVTLISVLENLDDSPESIILESVLEGMSEYYSRNLSREVMKGMRETALQCKCLGGSPPYGYKVNKETRKYEIDESEAEAVQFIFKSIIEGYSYQETVDRLNRKGYRNRKGQPFLSSVIHDILRNEKYRGVYIFNRSASKNEDGRRNNHLNKNNDEMIRIEGGIPAIVSSEEFFAVEAIMDKRKSHRTGIKGAKENYLLTGKIECGECGYSYTGARHFSGRNKDKYVAYQCNYRKKTKSQMCQNKEIRKEYLESFVLKEIAKIVFDDNNISKVVENYYRYHGEKKQTQTDALEKLKQEHKKISTKIENIVNAIAESGASALLSSLESLEEQRNIITQKISNCEKANEPIPIDEDTIRAAYKEAKTLFLSGDIEMQKRLINQYLIKVVTYKDHIEIFLNEIPSTMLKGEEDKIIEYVTANGAAQETGCSLFLRKKIADNPADLAKLSTKTGGGEENRTPVRNRISANVYECMSPIKFPDCELR